MSSSWSHNGLLRRVVTVISPDISFVIICPKCMQECDVTDDAVREGRYEFMLKFLAEHDHVARNELRQIRAVDREKLHAAVELLKAAML